MASIMSVRRAFVQVGVAVLALAVSLVLALPGGAFAEGTGSIRGRVIDSVTLQPVEGVRVVAGHHVGGGGYDTSDPAYTAADGTYSYSGLVPGEYMLYFEKWPEYSPIYYRDTLAWQTLEHVVVSADATTTPDDVRVRRYARLTGHVVRRSTGEDLAGIGVYAYRTPNLSDIADSASTDASGNYTLNFVLAGDYKLLFYGSGGAYDALNYCAAAYPGIYSPWIAPSQSATVTVASDGATSTVPLDMPMARKGSLTVNAVDWLTGAPVSGWCYTVWNPEEGGWPYGSGAFEANSLGTTFYLVPPGDWSIGYYFLPGPYFDYQYHRDDMNTAYWGNQQQFKVTDGEQYVITGRLFPTTPVSGRVTSSVDHTGVPGTLVEAFVRLKGVWTLATTAITTGADGSWSFAGLPPDVYRFKFTPPLATELVPSYFTGGSLVTSDVAALPYETVTGIDQELDPDHNAPSTNAVVAPDVARTGWSNATTVTVTLEATDGAGVGVATTHYRLGSSGTTQTYSDPIEITDEGTTTVWFASTDVYGNAETAGHVDVHVDRTPPTTSDSAASSYDLSASFSLSATDSLSGVALTEWSLNGGAWTTGTVVATASGGANTVRVRSTDRAGNVEPEREIAFTVRTKPGVGTPRAPKTMSHRKYYSVYGYLTPVHSKSSYPVRIYKWKKTSSGKWKSYGYVKAKVVYNSATSSKYSKSVRLSSAGKWRLRAYAPSDGLHVSAWSKSYDYVTVK